MSLGGWLSKDVAGLLKEHADPITYGRLLCTARVFQPANPYRLVRKLTELKNTLPKSPSGIDKAKTSYTIFREEMIPRIREERGCGYNQARVIAKKRWYGYGGEQLLTKEERYEYERRHTQGVLDETIQRLDANFRQSMIQRRKLVEEALERARNQCKDDESVVARAQEQRQAILKMRRKNHMRVYREEQSWKATEMRLKREYPTAKCGPSAYQCFVKQNFSTIKASLPADEQRLANVSRAVASRWKALSESEKKKYEEQSKALKVQAARVAVGMEEAPPPEKPATKKRAVKKQKVVQ